jgi:hypothetical protein
VGLNSLKSLNLTNGYPDRKVDIKDNQLGIKLIPMISTWDQVDPIFPVRILTRTTRTRARTTTTTTTTK